MNKFWLLFSALCLISYSSFVNAQNNLAGKSVFNLQLSDSKDHPTMIPFLGEKVLTILYTDPDVSDINDPLSDAIKAKKFPLSKYNGIGLVNCKDTWLPNTAIRMAVAKKEKRYPTAVILLDKMKLVAKNWNLGDCNNSAVILVIGTDKKIKFAKTIKTADESQALISDVCKILEQEIELSNNK